MNIALYLGRYVPRRFGYGMLEKCFLGLKTTD